MAERSPGTRRALWLVLSLVFAFLYIPIAVLVALSFNEGGLPTVWSGFSLKWYASLAGNDGDPVGRAQHADRGAGLDCDRHFARHAAGDRRRDAPADMARASRR